MPAKNQPQSLNPEALRIARERLGDEQPKHFAEALAQIAKELVEVRDAFKTRLAEEAKKLRDTFAESDAALDQTKKKGLDLLKQLEAHHEETMKKMREAQPELKDCEFSFDLDKGTFTPYGPLGTPPPSDEKEDNDNPSKDEIIEGISRMLGKKLGRTKAAPKKQEPEADDATKQMVADLMKRISEKKE